MSGGSVNCGADGDTSSFTYRYALAGDDSTAGHTVTGRVTVQNGIGAAHAGTMRTVITSAHPETADSTPLTFATTIDYSDFGVPVEVAVPQTSGPPDLYRVRD